MPRKVLVFIDWYLPGYKAGGPIQSCVNIIKHFKNDFDFRVATSDRDSGDDHAYTNIDVNHWNVLPDKTNVYYFSPQSQKFIHLYRVIRDQQPDVVYLNSLFSVFFTLYPLLIRKLFRVKSKYVIAPRGMLGAGALAIKGGKKEVFLKIAKLTGLYNNVLWHASTETEENEIRKTFGDNVDVIVARNLTAPRNLEYKTKSKIKNVLKLIFLSRISVKKNLLEALQFLEHIDEHNIVVFDIYGPVDDKLYWTQCLEKMKSLPLNVKCNYKGSVNNDKILETISPYHAMLLPTRHENFGHAIVEAFASSCPVIISDQTPWRGLSEKKAGWDIPLEQTENFYASINRLAEMEKEEYNIWSKGAFDLGVSIIKDESILQQNRQLFES